MSVPLIPRQRKISDAQFVGDLTSLFDRRGIKSGDPQSLEDFGSVLTSDDALRSDLFTLCTAISHMAESDLSGEQLLALVARALAGYKLLEEDGSVEIPESLRFAFVTGYEAWSNRGSELIKPLAWPPARPAQRSERAISREPREAISEPIAPKVLARGLRTVQEALDLARERTPFHTPAHRPTLAGTNIEGLNLNELKKLLEDILHRVSRIEPQPTQRTSIARSPIDDFGRRDDIHHFEGVHATKTPVQAAEPETWVDVPAETGASVILEPTDLPAVAMDEAAYLARHVYLRPRPRTGYAPFPAPVTPAPTTAAPFADSAAAPLVSSETLADPAPEPGSEPAVQSPLGSSITLLTSRQLRMIGGIAASALMIVIGYLGVLAYHDIQSRNVYAYHELKSSGQSTTSTSGQSSPPITETPPTPSETNSGVPRKDAFSSPPKASAKTALQPHRTSQPTATPVYVRSSEMMDYTLVAPRPVYPSNPVQMDGTVVLQVTISNQGSVISTRTVSGPVAMRSAAVRAVRMWRFKPYLVEGYPTQVITTVELPFKGK